MRLNGKRNEESDQSILKNSRPVIAVVINRRRSVHHVETSARYENILKLQYENIVLF